VSRGGVQGAEELHFDVADSADVTDTAVMYCVNYMGVGVNDGQRQGRQVVMKQLEIRGWFHNEAGLTSPRQPIRLVVFYDRQANGTTPAATDVMKTSAMLGLPKAENAERFKIIRDITIDYNTYAIPVVNAYSVVMVKHFKIPLGDLVTTYGADAADPASIRTGSLWVMTVGAVTSGASDLNKYLNYRLTYTQ